MIIERNKLYEILRTQLHGEYSIGLHGIDPHRLDTNDGFSSETKLSDNSIYKAAQAILSNGLVSNRTINGTVNFLGRIDDADKVDTITDGLEHYNYGGREIIILAVPVVFRDTTGREIFLGASNLNSRFRHHFDSTGYQESTLSDAVLSKSIIPNDYILGSYKLLPDGMVDVSLNRNHISFKENVVSPETLDGIHEDLGQIFARMRDFDLNSSLFTSGSKEELQKLYEDLGFKLATTPSDIFKSLLERDLAMVLETLEQYLNEENMNKLENLQSPLIDIDTILSNPEKKPTLVMPKNFTQKYEMLKSLHIQISSDGKPSSNFEGELELFNSLTGDTQFFQDAFENLDDSSLRMFLAYSTFFPKDGITTENLKRIAKISPHSLSNSPYKQLINDDLMKEIANQDDIKPSLLCYASDVLKNDFEFISTIILNSSKDTFDFYVDSAFTDSPSNLRYRDSIGDDVLTNGAFWDLLNAKIKSLYKGIDVHELRLFDKEKELEHYRGKKQSKTPLQQREALLSALEHESTLISETEALVEHQFPNSEIGIED